MSNTSFIFRYINKQINSNISHVYIVDWFTFNPHMTHDDIEFVSNDFCSITCLSLQERIALGSRAFHHGIHYWEITIQRYDDKSDPAFGIGKFDVLKENMLGSKD